MSVLVRLAGGGRHNASLVRPAAYRRRIPIDYPPGYVFNALDTRSYTHSTDSWASVAAVPAGNVPSEAQPVGDAIYVADFGASLQCDKYDPNAWLARNPPPAPANRGVKSGPAGDYMIAFGGELSFPGGDQTDEFDTVGNAWATRLDMLSGIDQHAGFGIGGLVFSCGGRGWTLPLGPYEPQLWCDIFSRVANVWVEGPPMPAPARYRVAGAAAAGYGFVFIGDDNVVGDTAWNSRFYPGAGSWLHRTSCLLAGEFGFAYSTGRYVYLLCITTDTDRNDCYDVDSNVWTNKTNCPVASSACGAGAPTG